MKKIIILLAIAPLFLIGQSKTYKNFIEVNIGIADIGGYDFNDIFPGASVLFGKTIELNSPNTIIEWQVGVALPSLITGKIALGYGNLKNNIALAVRPWPLTIGPQAKIGNFSFSFEVGDNGNLSFEAGLISTVGYRFTFGVKNKASAKID